jgi:hypothetical protein
MRDSPSKFQPRTLRQGSIRRPGLRRIRKRFQFASDYTTSISKKRNIAIDIFVNQNYLPATSCPPEGRIAIVTKRWARDAMDAVVPRRRVLLRTAKSCGPGAATLASIRPCLCGAGNGDNKGRSPGRARISRQTTRAGKAGMSRLYLSNPCALFTTHCTRLCGRSRRLAFPAPSVQERANEMANLGQIMPRERAALFACPLRPANGCAYERTASGGRRLRRPLEGTP